MDSKRFMSACAAAGVMIGITAAVFATLAHSDEIPPTGSAIAPLIVATPEQTAPPRTFGDGDFGKDKPPAAAPPAAASSPPAPPPKPDPVLADIPPFGPVNVNWDAVAKACTDGSSKESCLVATLLQTVRDRGMTADVLCYFSGSSWRARVSPAGGLYCWGDDLPGGPPPAAAQEKK